MCAVCSDNRYRGEGAALEAARGGGGCAAALRQGPARGERGGTWPPAATQGTLQEPDSRARSGDAPSRFQTLRSSVLRSPGPGSHLRACCGDLLAAAGFPGTQTPLRTLCPAVTPSSAPCFWAPPAPAPQVQPPASGPLQGPSPGAPRGVSSRPAQPRVRPLFPAPRRLRTPARAAQRPRPTFVRQPLQAECEVPPPAAHPGGRPAARPGLASPAPAPAPAPARAPPPPGRAAQRSAGEGPGPRAPRAWAAAQGVESVGRPPGARLRPLSPRLSSDSPRRARAFPGAGGGAGRRGRSRGGGLERDPEEPEPPRLLPNLPRAGSRTISNLPHSCPSNLQPNHHRSVNE
ncbi:translation initiation factor IF-2-like [Choloepus didactylus]|uniref:translation initiation factor IF-2-like n=1 Tax=Choloepus didactylus TaxID=27675 RepID=UPI00189DFB64|nr:translation initiation factor IF-2-like [Choloepus didactylus]